MNFSEHLAEHGVSRLFYIASLKNLESILERGILCRQSAGKYQPVDISSEDVQRLRAAYHSKVPLFFAPNTPMLYVCINSKGEGSQDVIMLDISPEVTNRGGVSFFDGNAAAGGTKKYSDPVDLDKLNWDVILKRVAWYGEWKRIKGAEIHIPKVCPPSYIRGIYFQSCLVDGYSKLSKIVSKFSQSHEILINNSLQSIGIPVE